MICGAEELIAVCQELVAKAPHTLSADGKFSWEEVECMGACANAPMAQIGKDYYEDLTADKLRALIGRFSNGEVPVPGPQNGRYAAEPLSGLTTLKDFESDRMQYNASAQFAVDIRDTVKRIDGTEVPLTTPWLGKAAKPAKAEATKAAAPKAADAPAKAPSAAKVAKAAKADAAVGGKQPKGLKAAKKGTADDLQIIEGIGPALEKLLHELGIFHVVQIAQWGEAEIAWIDANLKGFKGRATRDKWVAQAKLIGEVGIEEFLIRAKTNNY
jgi:NADH-quinone oxidoreductase subunit E